MTFSLPSVLGYFDSNNYSIPVAKGTAFFWWISLAYTINAILDRFVWQGKLTDDGLRRVPKLFTDLFSLLIYAIALMIVMHYVYEEPVTTILASSGAIAFVCIYIQAFCIHSHALNDSSEWKSLFDLNSPLALNNISSISIISLHQFTVSVVHSKFKRKKYKIN